MRVFKAHTRDWRTPLAQQSAPTNAIHLKSLAAGIHSDRRFPPQSIGWATPEEGPPRFLPLVVVEMAANRPTKRNRVSLSSSLAPFEIGRDWSLFTGADRLVFGSECGLQYPPLPFHHDLEQ